MRVLARIGCTLAALALIAPVAAWAGMPGPNGSGKTKNAKGKERLCADCMRMKLKAEMGLDMPPPPPLPPGSPAWNLKCTKCGRPAAVYVVGNVPMPLRTMPGYAVVGGPNDPGMVFSVEPAPIGVMEPRYATTVPSPASLRDTSVLRSTYSQNAIAPPPANKPHVISHMLGLSGIGRERAEARERKKREKHASIVYGTPAQPVAELPASMVYGRAGR
jgi:hypothetical protein